MQQKVLTEKGHKRQIVKVNNHLCSVQHFLVSFLPFEERGSYSSYNCLKLYLNVCKRGSGHALPCSVCQDICNVCCTFVVLGRLCCDIHLSKSRICSKDVLLQHSSTCHTQLQLPLQENWLSVTSEVLLPDSEQLPDLPDPKGIASGSLVPRSFFVNFHDDS